MRIILDIRSHEKIHCTMWTGRSTRHSSRLSFMKSKQLAWKIRRHAVDMTQKAKASHIAGVLSCADILAVLYSDVAKYDSSNPNWYGRDRIILSKGHSGAGLYAVLAECGFFPIEKLKSYGQNGSVFSCHVSHKNVPGVEITTGSLGHGVCVACGMALNAKIRNLNYRVYAIVGDGECNEGSVWETIMFAAHHRLSQFTIIVDANEMQSMGDCEDVLDMEPLVEKWKSFGWYVVVVTDGSNHDSLRKAFSDTSNGKPKVIIARTIKGKGISFMEHNLLWHYRDPQGEDYIRAVSELEDIQICETM